VATCKIYSRDESSRKLAYIFCLFQTIEYLSWESNARAFQLHLLESVADPGRGQGGHAMPPKDAEVVFWSTALWLIHWLWNTSNKYLCLKCTKIRLAAGLRPDPLWSVSAPPDQPTAIEGVLRLRGATFQLTGFRTTQLYWNTRPNGNAEFPVVPTFF